MEVPGDSDEEDEDEEEYLTLEARKKKLDEQVDSKIQNAFEKLRNDNLFIWKQSLELA